MRLNSRSFFFAFVLLFSTNSLLAQGLLTGKIVDAKTGNAVVKAKVEVPGMPVQIMDKTDEQGNYQIPKPPQGSFLKVAAKGYLKQTLSIGDDNVLNVSLEAKKPAKEKKESKPVLLTLGDSGAKVEIEQADFNQGFISDPALLIQNRVAGLQIYNRGGDPNQESQLRIRGLASFNQNIAPLIVVDGIPGVSLQSVDPLDIASFEILKDAAAAAAYGIRGANGVIIVKTKTINSDQQGIQLAYHGQLALSEAVAGIPIMTADEYLQNGGLNYGGATDWLEAITQTGIAQAHHLALSGNQGNTNYRFSGNARSLDGILRNTGFDRFNGRAHIATSLFKDKLDFSFNSSITSTTQDLGFVEAFRYAQTFNPTIPLNAAEALYPFNSEQYGGYFENLGLFDSFNPLSIVEQNENKRKSFLQNFSSDLSYQLLKQLKVNIRLGQQKIQREQREYYPTTAFFRGHASSPTRRGQAVFTNDRSTLNSLEGFLSSDNKFEKSRLRLRAGYYFQQNISSYYSFGLGDFPNNDIPYINQIESSQDLLGSGFVQAESDGSPKERIIAFWGDVAYSIKNLVFVNASLRREGSTRLGENNKWGLFPAINLGIDLNQSWEVPTFEYIKLNIGYGKIGGLPGTYRMSHEFRRFSYDPIGLLSSNTIQAPNPDLKWEEKKEINVSLDFKTDRLMGNISWYNQNASDFIYNNRYDGQDILAFWQYQNLGRINTKGIEIALRVELVKSDHWNYQTGIQFSRYKSILEEYYVESERLGNPGAPGNGATFTLRLKEGVEIGQIWGREFAGVDADGVHIYADVNGDGILQTNEVDALEEATDYKELGNAIPDFELGWSNEVSYKGWTLNAFFRGAFGHSLVNSFRLFYEKDFSNSSPYNIVNTELFEPGLISALFSSLYVEKASFLKLDNLTLAKKLEIKKYQGIEYLSIYLTAQNVFTLTKYTGTNPEPVLYDYGPSGNAGRIDYSNTNLLSPGMDRRNNYFPARTFLLGVRLGF